MTALYNKRQGRNGIASHACPLDTTVSGNSAANSC